eukprot:5026292-Heterocapsa_arctica.AAC.1
MMNCSPFGPSLSPQHLGDWRNTMETDVQEDARPQKKQRGQPSDMDREEETNERFMIDLSDGADATMEEANPLWERQIGAPAIFIEQMVCSASTGMKSETYIISCESVVGMWRICEDAKCYICNIIDKAENKLDITVEKGETIIFLGKTRT